MRTAHTCSACRCCGCSSDTTAAATPGRLSSAPAVCPSADASHPRVPASPAGESRLAVLKGRPLAPPPPDLPHWRTVNVYGTVPRWHVLAFPRHCQCP